MMTSRARFHPIEHEVMIPRKRFHQPDHEMVIIRALAILRAGLIVLLIILFITDLRDLFPCLDDRACCPDISFVEFNFGALPGS